MYWGKPEINQRQSFLHGAYKPEEEMKNYMSNQNKKQAQINAIKRLQGDSEQEET